MTKSINAYTNEELIASINTHTTDPRAVSAALVELANTPGVSTGEYLDGVYLTLDDVTAMAVAWSSPIDFDEELPF